MKNRKKNRKRKKRINRKFRRITVDPHLLVPKRKDQKDPDPDPDLRETKNIKVVKEERFQIEFNDNKNSIKLNFLTNKFNNDINKF